MALSATGFPAGLCAGGGGCKGTMQEAQCSLHSLLQPAGGSLRRGQRGAAHQ
jgi:hypothetical protein